ncbi:MAG: hypothetical protein KF764_31740 [Labilithrix sp.]|nr:hypothetical protein [Labilithrix sp.]
MALAKTIGRAAAVALLVAAPLARAQPPASESETPRFRLAYEAPEGCPDRAAFVSAVLARTSRPRLVEDERDGDAVVVRVAIASAGAESASGRLDLREPDGTEETRRVVSRTCAEVANALALVAAVMLDPDARTGPAPEPPPPEPPAPEPPPPAPPPPRATGPRPKPARSAPRSATWHLSAGAELGALGGIGPAVAPLAGLSIELERARGALVSTARLSADVARTSSDLRSGEQTYEWLGATLRVCPAYVSAWRLRFAPCAALQGGGHRGTTRDVRSPTTNVALWIAPAAVGAVEWPMSSAVSLELQGGVLFPLRRTRFYLAPASTIFDVPFAAGVISLGARVRWM